MSPKQAFWGIVPILVICFVMHSTLAFNYGEGCAALPAEPCNVTAHLLCNAANNTRCGCNSADLYYEETTGACIAFAGKPCAEVAQGGLGPIKCTKNSRCFMVNETYSMCMCNPNYLADNHGLCRMSHDVTGCQQYEDCNNDAFLTCSYGTCLCIRNNATVSDQHWNGKQCAVVVGGFCDVNDVCTPNSNCSAARSCACFPDYKPTGDGRCTKGLNDVCVPEDECPDYTTCKEVVGGEGSRCTCNEHQIEENGKCVVVPGQSCSNNPTCVAHSACDPSRKICICNDGFKNTTEGKCIGSHGTICDSESSEDVCDPEQFLVCSDKTEPRKCDCKVKYEFSQNRCKGWFGEFCKAEEDCVLSTKCNIGDQSPNGTCACLDNLGNPVDADGKCRVPYGGNCEIHLCDETKFQVCNQNEKLCACGTDLYYDEALFKCTALINGDCGTPNRPTCGTQAQCIEEKCKCNAGFSPIANMTGCESGAEILSGSIAIIVTTLSIVIKFL